MKTCVRQTEVKRTLQAGQWPQGCAEELREHVAGCPQCGEQVRFTMAFATARGAAMKVAVPQSPGLLWWKAQLRRRQQAMEKLERPGLAISTATMTASLVLLAMLLLAVWKRVEWSKLAAMFSPAGWSVWVVAALVFGFAAVALVVGLGLAEEREV